MSLDLDRFISDIKERNPMKETDLMQLFALAENVLYQDGTLLTLTAPITVCGDVHGQLYDVFRLLTIGGDPARTSYLFLGDYVDRGYYSIETFALLLAYKVRYPTTFFLLRGNHESKQVNKMYGFYEEILQRFGHPGIYKACNEIFDLLPLAAVINNDIFCVHGGLSPKLPLVEGIQLFPRSTDIPQTGPYSDILWSDPDDSIQEWGINQRGAGFLFGSKPVEEFLNLNRLKYMARAHQIAMEGLQWHHGDNKCVTVWSAPNYMYRSGNKASVMKVDRSSNPDFRVFDAVPDNERVIPTEKGLPPYFA